MNNSTENAHSLLFQTSINELKAGIAGLPQQQLTSCITMLQTHDHSDASERLIVITSVTDEPMRLEAIGKGLSLQQFLIVLNALSQQTLPIEKLSPLLVGLAPLVFQQALNQFTPTHLNILKRESLSEPLQHQLTLFSHTYNRLYSEQEEAVLQIYKKIDELKRDELSYRTLTEIENRISEIKNFAETHLATIDRALAITWTTNRLDLITNLSQLKEHFHHQSNQEIGVPTSLEHFATGLYAQLEQFLYSVFGATNSLKQSNEALEDSEAAIEGLAKFSIWYLPDYWQVGLLPNIASPEDLELDPSKYSEKQRLEHRQALFDQVQQNLTRLNLNQISDLKKFQIFSKNMLKEFISKNQQLLQKP
jgi:hypothetical protein